MAIIHIQNLSDPRVAPYSTLTEAQLRNRLHAEQAIFIAESPKVINVARIPMSHQVDSLNVAAAAALAFWELRAR